MESLSRKSIGIASSLFDRFITNIPRTFHGDVLKIATLKNFLRFREKRP